MDSVLKCSVLPEQYPMKLFLDIHCDGSMTHPEACEVTVLGLEKELPFVLTIPSRFCTTIMFSFPEIVLFLSHGDQG